MYLANNRGLLDPTIAFDLQVKQRILPRVRGSLALRDTLKQLTAFMRSHSARSRKHTPGGDGTTPRARWLHQFLALIAG